MGSLDSISIGLYSRRWDHRQNATWPRNFRSFYPIGPGFGESDSSNSAFFRRPNDGRWGPCFYWRQTLLYGTEYMARNDGSVDRFSASLHHAAPVCRTWWTDTRPIQLIPLATCSKYKENGVHCSAIINSFAVSAERMIGFVFMVRNLNQCSDALTGCFECYISIKFWPFFRWLTIRTVVRLNYHLKA